MNKCASNLREIIESTFRKTAEFSGKPVNLSSQKFISDCCLGLIDARSVSFSDIAMCMPGEAILASKVRRIQNFIAEYEIDYEVIAWFLLLLLPPKTKFKFCLDRTNWKFGSTHHNILVLSVYCHGVGIPIWFEVLGKAGNSNSDERGFLILELLKVIDSSCIEVLIADREFIGEEWIKFLIAEKMPFILRIRQNQYITINDKCVKLSTYLTGKRKVNLKNVTIFGVNLGLAAKKNNNEWLIVVTNIDVQKALTWYRKRWSIEVMFQSLKKRGFHLEQSHLTDMVRFRKLFALSAIAFALCFATGFNRHQIKPITLKNHGYKANSFFRHGLDFLRNQFKRNLDIQPIVQQILQWINANFIALKKIIM